ncbi:MAG TPA: geranylgeranyl reductase family protein [Burkholderiaceae bacterium]|nr:geranylgeranyl reductase family protein [Burkholderiaceae bacterium]
MRYDAVVIGAGPAGSRAAFVLAQAGRSVAIVERQPMPRDKVCGGALSGKALALLGPSVAPVLHGETRAADLLYRFKPFVAHEEQRTIAAMVVRREFDAWLHRRPIAAGPISHVATAEAVDQQAGHVVVATSAGPIEAAFALAADGASSTIRRQLFGRDAVRLSPAIEALVPVDRTVLQRFQGRATFDLGAVPGGYGWIFPKRDHLNVGVYSPYRHERLPAHLRAFIDGHPDIPAGNAGKATGYPIPTANTIGRFQQQRVWLLGDAAGLPEPLLGEGIYFALRSGELAARVLIEQGDAARDGGFDAVMAREMVPDLTAADRLARLLYRLPGMLVRRVFRDAGARQTVVALLTGETAYRDAAKQLARRVPGVLFPGY